MTEFKSNTHNDETHRAESGLDENENIESTAPAIQESNTQSSETAEQQDEFPEEAAASPEPEGANQADPETADQTTASEEPVDKPEENQEHESENPDSGTPMLAGKKSRADIAVDTIMKNSSFFHNSYRQVYAEIQIGKHGEVWPMDSKEFELLLRYLHYKETGTAMKKADLATAKQQVESITWVEGPEIEVDLRIAGMDGAVYVDLCNRDWEQVRITPEGWKVISSEESPVKFRRVKGMLPLPYPEPNGDLNCIRDLLSFENEGDSCMAISWLVMAMNPWGPYPVLVIQGEQGSGKSNFTRLLRSFVDPSTVPVRSLPRSERDLVISADSARFLCYDNVSKIKDDMSDSFCGIATGRGFSTRELYKNKTEVLFNPKRPMIFNGISDFSRRQDFADRTLTVTLQPMKAKNRLPESTLNKKLEALRPAALGALCKAVSEALKNFDDIQLEQAPRMADFAKWITAAEPALPWEKGRFMHEYEKNRHGMIDLAIEYDPVSLAVLEMMSRKDAATEWKGTPTNLLKTLENYVPDNVPKKKDWPHAPNIFSRRLLRVQGFLREKGIEIETGKSGDRFITIRKRDVEEAKEFGIAPDMDALSAEPADDSLYLEAGIEIEEGEC